MKIRGFVALAGLAATAISASASSYAIDDGGAEDSIGLQGTAYDSVWLNTFSLTGGDTAISQISVAFGTPLAGPTTPSLDGQAVTILLYTDATGGSPIDATLVWSFNTTITNANTNTFNNYAVPNVAVGTNFVVGFRYSETRASGSFPAAWDSTAPTLPGRSFAGFDVPANTIDPANLAGTIPAANFGDIGAFGLAGNWLIRAEGVVPTPGAASLLGLAGLAGLRRRR